MEDKSLNIMLIVIFGMAGTAILTLAWLQPMSLIDRLLTTIIALIGLLWMVIRVVLLVLARVNAKYPR